MRFLLANPTASLYNNRTQVVAALEFACLDLLGQSWGVPVCDILGGRVRDRVPFASYLFFRYADRGRQGHHPHGRAARRARAGAEGAVRVLVAQAERRRVPAGVRPRVLPRASPQRFPGDSFRFDPNAVWTTEQAIRFGRAIEDLDNDYLEDPVFGLTGMRHAREKLRLPLATNTVVVNFEQLAANVLNRAVDVILLDTTFWGGIRPCVKAAGVCETFQLGVAVHSSGELGIQLATMLHLGAVVPNLSFAADAHYHHLVDDIIEGGKLQYEDGAIRVPDAPGLGVRLDRAKAGASTRSSIASSGNYPYDQDPARPGWAPLVPNDRWADPTDPREPFVAG